MRAWAGYAMTGLALTAVAAAVATRLVDGPGERAVLVAALIAWTLQLGAFAALLAAKGRNTVFMISWLGGMALRFAALAACAFWVTRTGALPAPALLVSLVAFMFLLVLLEPVFLRRGLRTS